MPPRLLVVVDSAAAYSTSVVAGYDYQELFRHSGWDLTILDCRSVGSATVLAHAKVSDLVYLLKVPDLKLIRRLRRESPAKLIFYLSDALWMPLHRDAGWSDLDLMIAEVDAIFTDNRHGADYGRLAGKSVFINSVGVKLPERISRPDRDAVSLGWIGSESTRSSVERITPALLSLLGRHQQLELRLVGVSPSSLPSLRHDRIHFVPVYDHAQMVTELGFIDIGLFPMPFDQDDYGVRGLRKTYLYMLGGCATVSSHADIPAVTEILTARAGLTAQADEWETELERLITDADFRGELASRGQAFARQRYSLDASFRHLEASLLAVHALPQRSLPGRQNLRLELPWIDFKSCYWRWRDRLRDFVKSIKPR